MTEKRYGYPVVEVYPDSSALVEATVEFIANTLREALSSRDMTYLAVSGGSTPKPVYARLNGLQGIDFNRLVVCFVDERNVPPDDADSNFRMVKSAWFDSEALPKKNILRIAGELDADVAAAQYEAALKDLKMPQQDGFPVFDLIWLGMGPDGHCASLFPGSPALSESERWVAGNWVEKMNTHRITLTYPVLNHARTAMFMVADASKAEALADVLSGGSDLPAARVHPKDGRLIWMVDEAAAGLLR